MDLAKGSQGTAVKQLQTDLQQLGFYAGKLDSDFGSQTQAAVKDFQSRDSQLVANGIVESKTSTAIQSALSRTPFSPFSFFVKFKRIQDQMFANGAANNEHFAFLDRGIDEVKSGKVQLKPGEVSSSPTDEIPSNRNTPESILKKEIPHYPDYLLIKPDHSTLLAHPDQSGKFSDYPSRDHLPDLGIEKDGLSFLSPDIQQACVCIGSFDSSSNLKARWLGRNALKPTQFWSSTKFVPVLNLVCQANQNKPSIPVDECNIKGSAETIGFPFSELVVDLVSYRKGIDHSNVLAEMFKRFETKPHPNLETWLSRITHNNDLEFQGGYTPSDPFRKFPTLFQLTSNTPVVQFQDPGTGSNHLSAYDLVRMISMLGWHNYLSDDMQLPDAQWSSLSSVVKCMGTDTARYVDVALEALELESFISSPVVISKLGFGTTGRGEDALTYTAFVQFIDSRSSLAKLRSFAFALRIPTSAADGPKADARMATEVTEIIRRIVTEELV